MKQCKQCFLFLCMAAFLVFLTACSHAGQKQKQGTDDKNGNDSYEPSFQDVDLEVEKNGITKGCVAMKSGRLYFYVDFVGESEGGGFERKKEIISCEQDGSDIVKTDLDLAGNETGVELFLDDEGELRLLTEDGKNGSIYTLDEEGNITETIALEKYSKVTIENNAAVIFKDTIYLAQKSMLSVYGSDGKLKKNYDNGHRIDGIFEMGGKIVLYEMKGNGFRAFDPETEKLGQLQKMKEYAPSYVWFYPAGENQVYINDFSALVSYDLGAGTLTEIANWTNMGVDNSRISGFFPLENGNFLAVLRPSDEAVELVSLNRVKAEDAKKKEVLTFSCDTLKPSLQKRILAFNREHEDVCIEVRDYGSYENGEERMRLDFTTGNVPDIIDASLGSVPFQNLAKKGMFTDLYTLLEQDKEIGKEDFLPSVLKALEIDGKLYSIGSDFCIQGLVSGKDVVGDREGWTVEEMMDAYGKLPDGSCFLDRGGSRNEFMKNVLHEQFRDYVDLSAGEVSFAKGSFLKLLQFSRQLPKSGQKTLVSAEKNKMIKEGTLFMQQLLFTSVLDIQMFLDMYQDQGGISVLSYPSQDGNSDLSASFATGLLAITENCKNKEAAWEFVRTFLTYDYQKEADQDGNLWLSARQDYFEEQLKNAMKSSNVFGMDPLSEEDADMIRSVVSRAVICSDYQDAYEDIYAIVEEELGAFYAGDRTAKEAAKMIENRVNLYVNENS